MLPPEHRLRRSSEFSDTVRRGVRRRSGAVVVHVRQPELTAGTAVWGGPRMGLIVSKAVGNAVVRHAVSRRLRHAWLEASSAYETLPVGTTIVIRALPEAREAQVAELVANISSALGRLV